MKIFIIGAGIMGGAIAKALIKAGQKVFVYDKNSGKIRIPGAVFDPDLKNLAKADYVLIAVKPQDIKDLSSQIKISPHSVLLSIVAGMTIAKLQKYFQHSKIVRIMPNLGLSVGVGIAAWKSSGLSAKEKIAVKKFLNEFTEHFEVRNESDLDSVTAISGSGPAYFFYLAEALEKAAIKNGFERSRARILVEKTFLAAAILQKNQEYQNLINQVASKKGTTEAALEIFKKNRFSEIIIKATQAARKRSEEISRG